MKLSHYTSGLILFIALVSLFPGLTLAQEESGKAAPQAEIKISRESLVQAYQNKQWDEAIQIADKLLVESPEDITILSVLGTSLAQSDQNERAEQIFLKVLAQNPADPAMTTNLCYAKSKLNRADASDTCIKAADLNPNQAEIQHLAAQSLEHDKRLDEAHKYYLKAWNLEPSNLIYLTAATSIEFNTKDYKSAYEHTKAALDSGQENPILYLNALAALNRLGNYEEAIRLADICFPKYHDDSMLLSKAEALYKSGNPDEARKIFEEMQTRTAEKALYWAKLQYHHAQCLIRLSCGLDTASTCQTNDENPCCQYERDAQKMIESVARSKNLSREDRLPIVYAITQVINGNLKEAEQKLTNASKSDVIKHEADAALAVVLYMFGTTRDQETGIAYLGNAIQAAPEFGDPEKVANQYFWPKRMTQTLEAMIKQRNESAQPKAEVKSGCGCEIAQTAPHPGWAAILALLISILVFVGLRRTH